ncbi:MAG: hypothetical protein MUF59_01910, partial [Candidatus Krumholzibacteria bacterium]|nr:hypothetical protein [Candidatus Krumholzibacteria bacterium]
PGDLDLPGTADPEPGPEGRETGSSPAGEPSTLKAARDELERRMVLGALLRYSGNVSAAAQELDISRPSLHDLMNRHRIDPEDFRSMGRKKKG